MRIPARFAPLVFSALLSGIMVCIVSAFVLVSSQGLHAEFPEKWLRSCLTTWPVAFPTVAVVAPFVKQVVARVVDGSERDNRETTEKQQRNNSTRGVG